MSDIGWSVLFSLFNAALCVDRCKGSSRSSLVFMPDHMLLPSAPYNVTPLSVFWPLLKTSTPLFSLHSVQYSSRMHPTAVSCRSLKIPNTQFRFWQRIALRSVHILGAHFLFLDHVWSNFMNTRANGSGFSIGWTQNRWGCIYINRVWKLWAILFYPKRQTSVKSFFKVWRGLKDRRKCRIVRSRWHSIWSRHLSTYDEALSSLHVRSYMSWDSWKLSTPDILLRRSWDVKVSRRLTEVLDDLK